MKLFFVISSFMIGQLVVGQSLPKDTSAVQADTSQFFKATITPDSVARRRNELNHTNLSILAAWAGANIVQSSISATNAMGSDKAFFKMNAYWNTVNLAIAGVGLYRLKKEMGKKMSLQNNINEQHNTEKFLLINSGLDAAYIMGGFYLNNRGVRIGNEQTEGYGKSLVLQGSFLLVFDVVQYFLHKNNGKALKQWSTKGGISASTNGLGIRYSW